MTTYKLIGWEPPWGQPQLVPLVQWIFFWVYVATSCITNLSHEHAIIHISYVCSFAALKRKAGIWTRKQAVSVSVLHGKHLSACQQQGAFTYIDSIQHMSNDQFSWSILFCQSVLLLANEETLLSARNRVSWAYVSF